MEIIVLCPSKQFLSDFQLARQDFNMDHDKASLVITRHLKCESANLWVYSESKSTSIRNFYCCITVLMFFKIHILTLQIFLIQ